MSKSRSRFSPRFNISEKYKKALEESTHRCPEVDSNQSILEKPDIKKRTKEE